MNLINSVFVSGVCVAALALPLSGCADTNQSASTAPIPLDKEVSHPLMSGLGSLSNKLTREPLPASDWDQLPSELQGSYLLKPTNEAKNSQGIISGKIYGDSCVILYLKRATPSTVQVAIGTYTDKEGSREFILDNLTGAQARDYPQHHFPCL